MAYKQPSSGLPFKQMGSSPIKQYKKPTGPRAEIKVEKLRTIPYTDDEMDKNDFISTMISEGSIESQELRLKKNKAGKPLKQTYVTDEMRAEKSAAELAFNKKMMEEGFSSDTNLKGASAELLALQERFKKSRAGFIQKRTEAIDRGKAQKGLIL